MNTKASAMDMFQPRQFTIRDFDGDKERLKDCCNKNLIFFYGIKDNMAIVIARPQKLVRFLHEYYDIRF